MIFLIVGLFVFATIGIDIATIITTPIFQTPNHCAPSHLPTPHTEMIKIWGIVQSIPLLIAFTLLVIYLFGPSFSAPFVPSLTDYIDITALRAFLSVKVLPQLHPGPYSVEERYVHITTDGGNSPNGVQMHYFPVNKCWQTPQSTARITTFYSNTIEMVPYTKTPPQPGEDVREHEIRTLHNGNDRQDIQLSLSLYRPIHQNYYYPTNTMYSTIPPGHISQRYLLDQRIERVLWYIGLTLTAIHIALTIWGTILIAKHWHSGLLCPGDEKFNKYILFQIIYHWFIPASFGIMYIIFHAV